MIAAQLVPTACPPRTRQATPNTSIDAFSAFIELPDTTDYVLGYDWPVGGTIAQLRVGATSGSGFCQVLINGNVVTGLDNVPILAGHRTELTAFGANHFSPGDDIVFRLLSQVNLQNLQVTLAVSNTAVAKAPNLIEIPTGLIAATLPIIAPLVGLDRIPVVILPALTKKPIIPFAPVFEKTSPLEVNVFCVGIDTISENGFFVNTNTLSVVNQIMHYGYFIQN